MEKKLSDETSPNLIPSRSGWTELSKDFHSFIAVVSSIPEDTDKQNNEYADIFSNATISVMRYGGSAIRIGQGKNLLDTVKRAVSRVLLISENNTNSLISEMVSSSFRISIMLANLITIKQEHDVGQVESALHDIFIVVETSTMLSDIVSTCLSDRSEINGRFKMILQMCKWIKQYRERWKMQDIRSNNHQVKEKEKIKKTTP